MPGRFSRNRAGSWDFWPGYVDALASLLLVFVLMFSVFMVTKFLQDRAATDKDQALDSLRSQVAELSTLLNLAKQEKKDLAAQITDLQASLASAQSAASASAAAADGDGNAQVMALKSELEAEKKLSASAKSQIALLNRQLDALRQQIASLQAALEASEAKDRANKATIADLGRRLNAALARKVQELARYRSDFFGRLREILGNRSDIEIVGDRFVFQSEVLFSSGSSTINPQGRTELKKLASALEQLETEIPEDIKWVLRVDGHTDAVPIKTEEFPSNWHLSSARAISVVQYLASQGVSPDHLVAAGFGEFQPLAQGTTPAANKRNRRIEMKLTER